MTDDELRLLQVRRDFEKQGIGWNEKVSFGTVMALSLESVAMVNKAFARIAALEKRLEGVQKAVDHHDRHALIFRGDWQAASEYSPGCVVRHRGAVYTALKGIAPGKAEPGRQGSGWDLIV